MINSQIWVPILLSAVMIFIFYTSGAIIFELLKFKVKNAFVYIAGGFFAYFTFISIFSFPLQLVSIIPYVFFVYYFWTLTIIYLIFCLVFLRHWITARFFSKNTLIFLVCVGVIGIVEYFAGEAFVIDTFARHKNALSIIYWLRDNPVSFFNNSTFYNFLGFKPFESWYTFQISIIMLSGASTYQIQDVILPFTYFIEVVISASIFITMVEAFAKNKTKYMEYLTLVVAFIFFIASKTALIIYGYSFWTGEMMLVNLIFYAIILTLKYTSFDYRERHKATFIGMVIGGYISFAWDNSYHILFFLYCILFMIQRKYSKSFTKDILKISMFALIDICFYNIILKLYIQAFIFSGLLALMIVISYYMTSNYSVVLKFETFVDNRIRLVTLILPVIFMTISIGMSLNAGISFINAGDNYLNFLYVWTTFISGSNQRYITTYIVALIILVGALVWIFMRQRFKENFLTDSIDLMLISYLTFYNPIVVKFINLFYPTMTSTNGIMMIIQGMAVVNVLVIWLCNKVDAKKPDKLKIIKNYNWIK